MKFKDGITGWVLLKNFMLLEKILDFLDVFLLIKGGFFEK
jgi:hypothetical protein